MDVTAMEWSFEGANAVEDLSITPLKRVVFATVRRVNPDGTLHYLYPIFDKATAERALFLLPMAKPPLAPEEQHLVIERAKQFFLPGHERDHAGQQ